MNPGNWNNQAIIACATGSGSSALSVFRISGFSSLSIFNNLLRYQTRKVVPTKIYRGSIIDENNTVDDICFIYFEGPKSFTGENVLELYCHGNPFLSQKIIDIFCSHSDIRLAYPGEFSYRAYQNKKMSLSQIEGLDLFLNSTSAAIQNLGFKALQGDLNQEYLTIWKHFIDLRSSLEIIINFSEDVGEDESLAGFKNKLSQLSINISKLKLRCSQSPDQLKNPKIVLLGSVNAGKSSLFNHMLHQSRSIVSNIAGTTRDYISENIRLDSTTFSLVDTAGLRVSEESIEQEGIQRSLALASHAFFKILVINPSDEKATGDVIDEIEDVDLLLLSHGDISIKQSVLEALLKKVPSHLPIRICSLGGPIGPQSSGPIEPLQNGPIGPQSSGPIEPLQDGPIGPKFMAGPIGPDNISLCEKIGPIEPATDIHDLILHKFNKLCENNPIVIERHIQKINETSEILKDLTDQVESTLDAGVYGHYVEQLERSLEELIGIIAPDEVLDHIFDNFCIGK